MIKKELLTVGELAKEMDVTVRTLQYYDKQGLLNPSSKSNGGRRLYNKKDVVKLHQILSLKSLGFSLDEIKVKLFSLDNPDDVAKILENQSKIIENQIENLKFVLETITLLHNEVLQMKTVDFSKYADIISLLKQKNENYWVIKHFDDKLLSHMKDHFKDNQDNGIKLFNTYSTLLNKAVKLHMNRESPFSDKSMSLAKEWWTMINEFTAGDMSLLPELMKFNENKTDWNNELATKQKFIDEFIGQALMTYLEKQNLIISEMEDKNEK